MKRRLTEVAIVILGILIGALTNVATGVLPDMLPADWKQYLWIAWVPLAVIVLLDNQPAPAPALHRLRAPVGDFVGRADEIDQLVQALRQAADNGAAAAISGVRGMGGIGKTELAYSVAQRLKATFPDAQLLVELRGASQTPLSAAQALQAVIRVFEPEAKLPDDLAQLTGHYNFRRCAQSDRFLRKAVSDSAS